MGTDGTSKDNKEKRRYNPVNIYRISQGETPESGLIAITGIPLGIGPDVIHPDQSCRGYLSDDAKDLLLPIRGSDNGSSSSLESILRAASELQEPVSIKGELKKASDNVQYLQMHEVSYRDQVILSADC